MVQIIFEQLTVTQLVKKFLPSIYWNRIFITTFAAAHHLDLAVQRSPKPQTLEYYCSINSSIPTEFVSSMRTTCHKEDNIGGACSTHWKVENAYKILVGKLEGKRPLGRPRRRWEDNIRLDRGGTGWEGVD
jgi:hypothetical protein